MSTSTAALPPRPLREDASVIGLVGLGHLVSHFSQLLLAPLFPWLKEAFNASYTELGFLMTIFFVVSCSVQAASGFLVDKHGARPVLFGGLALLGVAAFGFAMSPSYWSLAFFAVVAAPAFSLSSVFAASVFCWLLSPVSCPPVAAGREAGTSTFSPALPMAQSGAPISTWLPSGAKIFRSVPSKNDSSSIVALSVSTSASMSPDFTASPSFFSHLTSVPTVMVSLSFGISIMLGMFEREGA